MVLPEYIKRHIESLIAQGYNNMPGYHMRCIICGKYGAFPVMPRKNMVLECVECMEWFIVTGYDDDKHDGYSINLKVIHIPRDKHESILQQLKSQEYNMSIQEFKN